MDVSRTIIIVLLVVADTVVALGLIGLLAAPVLALAREAMPPLPKFGRR